MSEQLHFLWWNSGQWAIVGSISAVVALIGLALAFWQILQASKARVEQSLPYVVASPIPELSEGRQACLLIRNYGTTAAYDLEVTFPDVRAIVAHDKHRPEGGFHATRALDLAVSMLAPGQEVTEWVSLMVGPDEKGVRRATAEVSYSDWRRKKKRNVQRYEIAHGPSALFGKPDHLAHLASEAATIGKTLRRWSAEDGSSLHVETPVESRRRVFGESEPPKPDGGLSPASPGSAGPQGGDHQ